MLQNKSNSKKSRLRRFLTQSEGFISKAMKTERRRQLSISPSGRRTTSELTGLKVYSCPELKLPSLVERASRSKTRLLYEMSAELLNSDDEENLANRKSNDAETIVTDSSQNASFSDVESRKVEEFYQIKTNKMAKYNQNDSLIYVATCDEAESIASEIENDLAVQQQLQMVQVTDDNNLDSSSTTAVEKFEMPTASERLSIKRNMNVHAPQPPEKSECWGSYTKMPKAVKSIANQTSPIAHHKLEYQRPAKCETFSVYGNNNSKCDYGIWLSLFLLLFTFAYLYYILWRDVSRYVNRCRKYRKLIAESGKLMTIYYYVIYLLDFSELL